MTSKISFERKELIHFAIMAAIVAIFFVCPPFHPALTPIGMKLFGVFIASCYGWTAVGLFWPTLFCFCLLPFTGICTMGELLVAGVGNNIFFYLFFIFMLSALISESGLADFIAKWMMSRKALQGKPWLIVLVFMLATCICSMVTSNIFLSMFLMWGIAISICENCGYGKKSKPAALLITATTCCALMGYSVMPYQGIAMILTNAFGAMSGTPIEFVQYVSFSLPMAFLTVVVMWFVLKTFFKTDLSAMANLDVNEFAKDLHLSTKAKIVAVDLIVFVSIVVLAGFFKNSPFGLLQAKVDNLGIIALTMLPLLFIQVDGERVWNVKRTFNQISLDILMVCAFILPLGTYMANASTGISAMFISLVQPVLGGLSPMMLALVICVVTLILTQFMTNMVVAYMFFPVIIGLSKTMGFDAIPQALLAIYMCHVAILIPAACSYAAMTHAHDWVESRGVTKYGVAFVIAGMVVCVFGYFWSHIIV